MGNLDWQQQVQQQLELSKRGRDALVEGDFTAALALSMESVKFARELAAATAMPTAKPILAHSLMTAASPLIELGRHEEALAVANEALDLCRSLAASERGEFGSLLATALSLRAGVLDAMAARVGREHGSPRVTNPESGKRERPSAASASQASVDPSQVGFDAERALLGKAIDSSDDALELLRDSVRRAPKQFGEQLAQCLAHRRGLFGRLDRLASCLYDLGLRMSASGDQDAATVSFRGCIDICREFGSRAPATFLPRMGVCLKGFGDEHGRLGHEREVADAYRGCAVAALQIEPVDPFIWCQLWLEITSHLSVASDLRDFHLPLLGLLSEHRELAWNSEHAGVFLDLQAQVALRVWGLLANLPPDEGDLLDQAVAALVAVLHSPDLARWLEARGTGDGPLAKLAEFKREVLETEQLLAALRKGLPGGGDARVRALSSGPGTEAQRDALMNDIEHQSARAQALRQAFRDERARLVAEDPRFASAFEPVGAQALRSIAGHAQGGALLCMLELGDDGAGQPERSSSEGSRSVAALLHADGRRTQLLELAGVHELAWHAQNYRPEALGVNRRGPLRGAPAGATRSVSDRACPPPITDLLAPRMSESFWAPLQQALQASGVAVERLHVCLHGTTQQLPLALRQAGDCPGLQVVPWPGLPYLRRAAMAASAKSESHTGADASAPWLVGHDCAWGSEQPLPMVAVEAALLRDLLQRHGQPVQQLRLAAQLHGQASALVACCHGGAEQAQFDHALHLGQEPLTVRQIVQENLGPPLALLPACHAGRTDEDAAGNALGVAAAFMLSGTQVVAASSKAVPDLLQPWLSTLTVWHAMQGLPHHDAANLAREQFARLDFPAGYRSWLQQALPQALATIQPGGEEDEHIRGVHAQTALEQVEERWPWEGETKDLFSADPARRDAATRSVVQGVLKPRGGEAGALALAAEAREMAAFVFVYGVDSASGCVRHEPDQDAGRPAAERII